ncbi:serine/threonine-protein kinase [Actinokineospora sp. UTMC 2448]|uniref:serine/threonine-protein kinase n=1 Tax=Actinokineospora sp. UTMC 2448 TaxID=2268449 RepID=UPI0021643D44|nr:serine/threonine-protein kinase [Actinokineospora sp. UTMC 2448]UVS82036.1 Serine/threonine-protein kinase PknK [Actinokineospora sp. UTMC 2448]
MLPTVPGLAFVRPLGQGGFGTVHLARQHRLDRDVAVKLDNRVLTTERDQARFLREARAAARLSGHPNVVNVYDAGVAEDGRPYIVMELCTGGSLADVLRERGPLPVDEVVEMGARLADALARMHAAGILHRDIKPANILVNAFGAVKLADFGLAAILDAHAESTVTVGALSPHYAAPEVFAHAAPSPAGDLYSLAATLYTLIAGSIPRTIPWPADSLDQLVGALNAPVPPIPHAPPAVNAALLGALAADPAARTDSAERLRDELSGLRPARQAPRVERRRRAAAVLAVPALLAAGFLGRGFLPPDERTAEPEPPPESAVAAPAGMAECPGHETDGYCVADRCFGGLVNSADMQITARPIPCTEPHAWQAFSGLPLPPEAATMTGTQILALPQVSAACSARVMTARAGVDTAGWAVEVLPSPDRASVLCLASEPGAERTGSAFGPG